MAVEVFLLDLAQSRVMRENIHEQHDQFVAPIFDRRTASPNERQTEASVGSQFLRCELSFVIHPNVGSLEMLSLPPL